MTLDLSLPRIPPPPHQMTIFQDIVFEVTKNIPLKMKIVQDFGFEVTKNTPSPTMKIVQDLGFDSAKNTPNSGPLENENCSGTLDLMLPRLSPPHVWIYVQGTGVWILIAVSPKDTIYLEMVLKKSLLVL